MDDEAEAESTVAVDSKTLVAEAAENWTLVVVEAVEGHCQGRTG